MTKIWRTLVESIKGEQRDYTEGSISKAVVLLGIPMVLEMLMESVFAVTDIFFVGKLGPNAIATIGLTESLLTIVYTIAFGLSIGAMAMMSRRVGEHDPEAAAKTAVQVLCLGLIVSILIGLVGIPLAPTLLTLMGAQPDVIATGGPYARVMFAGNAAIIFLFLGNAVMRGAGDGTIAMRALFLANGINLVLAPCFINGFLFIPALGVTGAAYATTLSRAIGAAYTLSHLFRGKGRIKVQKHHWTIDAGVMWRIMKLSGSGTFQIFISTASWVGLARVVAMFGSDATAGYTIGIRTILFAIFPAFGLSNAAATMVGQSLGAKKPERAEKAVWLAGFYNLAFLGVMGILFLVFAPIIVGWFTHDPIVAGYAISCLRTLSCGFPFYAFGMVITQSFNGAGDTWTPTWINFFVFWMFGVPMAYVLAVHGGMGPSGTFLANTLAFSALAVVSAVLFRRGRWKTQKV